MASPQALEIPPLHTTLETLTNTEQSSIAVISDYMR